MLVLLVFAGCASPTGGPVRIEGGGKAGIVETGSDADSRAVKLDKTKADNVNVTATYGALDRNVARISMVAGLAALGLFLLAWGAPSPRDARLTLGLYLAAASSIVAALGLGWRFFM